MLELQLLNAIIEKRDFSALVNQGLSKESEFFEQKEAFRYIKKHLQEFGELPSVDSVVENCEGFEPVDVVESIETLCRKVHERNLKIEEKELLKDVANKFGTMDAYKILTTLKTKIDEMHEKSLSRTGKNGVNWSLSGNERFKEYEARKQKDFTSKLPCIFDEVTEAVGGLERGEYVTFIGDTGKGKSWCGILQALVANKAGFKVLIESAEMSKSEVEFRLDTLEGKFSNRGLWTGSLGFEEDSYKTYTQQFTKENSTRSDLVIKTTEDWANGLTLEQLEYDIDKTKCDMIVIDQFNLCRFKGSNHSDKAEFSRQLKQLAAKKGVVLVLLYQTNGDSLKQKKKEGEVEELKVIDISSYSETIAVPQDSNKLFGFHSVTWKDQETGRERGKALLTIIKSRTGGTGLELELNWCPNDGVMTPRTETDIF